MNTSTNVVHLRQPEELEDPLTDILRSGARRLLAQAVELEAGRCVLVRQAARGWGVPLAEGAGRCPAAERGGALRSPRGARLAPRARGSPGHCADSAELRVGAVKTVASCS